MAVPVTSRCSIANSLDVLGQKWSLLIVREAMWGRTRFSQFRERLGVAPDVLTDRLARLVDAGVLTRSTYRDDGAREREEYLLTPAGQALRPVLAAFVQWGDEYRPTEFGPAATYADGVTGEPVRLAFVTEAGRVVPAEDVVTLPGPGAVGDGVAVAGR
jgi:DNA-binding HxlR family transcriptional regulator